MKKVSLILVFRDEKERLSILVEHLLNQDYSSDDMEIIIIDGKSTDGSFESAQSYTSKHPHIKLITNNKKEDVFGYNLAIKQSSGEFIFFMDIHADYPSNYVTHILSFLEEQNAMVTAGKWQIKNTNTSLIAESISAALGSHFVVGNAQFRMDFKKIIATNILPSACYRKEAFETYGLFDETLLVEFEFEMCGRIISKGGKAVINPEMVLDYYGPENLNRTMQFFYQSAYYKPFINENLQTSATFRQLAPSLAVLFFVFSAITSFISPLMLLLFIFAGMVYLFGDIWESFGIGIEKDKARLTTVLIFIFPLIHMSYGLGYLHGLWNRRLKNKKKELNT